MGTSITIIYICYIPFLLLLVTFQSFDLKKKMQFKCTSKQNAVKFVNAKRIEKYIEKKSLTKIALWKYPLWL